MDQFTSYSSLKELQQRKERIREDLQRGTKDMTRLCQETFVPTKPDTRKEAVTRAVNIGFMVFDGIMLAKKLDSKYAIVMKSLELIHKWQKGRK
ncbi:MAG: hypothetical protein IJ527_04625 [Prevotella sp.]|nr:hypothetical protein [Prevotella sp.]